MEYAAWKLFIDAAELGSLSKVAVAYGTSQPHISRQISELEQECGGRLFQRTGRGVVLTELGQRIAPKVRAWLAEHRAACERRAHLRRHADRQGADRQPAVDRASAGEHAVQAAERAISAHSAGGARRARGAARDLAGGRQRRSCNPLSNEPVTEEWRYLPRRDVDLSRQRGRRPADVAEDRTLFSAAQSAARAVLPPEQLAQSPRTDRRRAQGFAQRRPGGRLAQPANPHRLRRRHLRPAGTLRDRRRIEGLPPAIVEAGRSGRHAAHCARHVASWQPDARLPDRDADPARDCEIRRGGTAVARS